MFVLQVVAILSRWTQETMLYCALCLCVLLFRIFFALAFVAHAHAVKRSKVVAFQSSNFFVSRWPVLSLQQLVKLATFRRKHADCLWASGCDNFYFGVGLTAERLNFNASKEYGINA